MRTRAYKTRQAKTLKNQKKKKRMSDSEDTEGSCADWNITREWLEGILSEHLGSKDPNSSNKPEVTDFQVRPGCNAGESVLSDILAVSLKYRLGNDDNSTSKQLSLIVKRLPQDPYSRFFVTEAQFDLREIRFYTQVYNNKYAQ